MEGMSRKADVAVTLLVIMTLVATVSATFMFITKNDSVELGISDAGYVNSVYLSQEKIDFYISKIVKNAAENSKSCTDDCKEVFAMKLVEEMDKYIGERRGFLVPALGEIKKQVDAEKILFDSASRAGRVKFDVSLSEVTGRNGEITIKYDYSKEVNFNIVRV